MNPGYFEKKRGMVFGRLPVEERAKKVDWSRPRKGVLITRSFAMSDFDEDDDEDNDIIIGGKGGGNMLYGRVPVVDYSYLEPAMCILYGYVPKVHESSKSYDHYDEKHAANMKHIEKLLYRRVPRLRSGEVYHRCCHMCKLYVPPIGFYISFVLVKEEALQYGCQMHTTYTI